MRETVAIKTFSMLVHRCGRGGGRGRGVGGGLR